MRLRVCTYCARYAVLCLWRGGFCEATKGGVGCRSTLRSARLGGHQSRDRSEKAIFVRKNRNATSTNHSTTLVGRRYCRHAPFCRGRRAQQLAAPLARESRRSSGRYPLGTADSRSSASRRDRRDRAAGYSELRATEDRRNANSNANSEPHYTSYQTFKLNPRRDAGHDAPTQLTCDQRKAIANDRDDPATGADSALVVASIRLVASCSHALLNKAKEAIYKTIKN
jgi:hypothetical protein